MYDYAKLDSDLARRETLRQLTIQTPDGKKLQSEGGAADFRGGLSTAAAPR
jgi:hypothetical protein